MAGQMYDIANLGGLLSVPTLSKKLHHKVMPLMRFAQFVRAEETGGMHKGRSFQFDKIDADLTLTPTATSDLLAEDAPIPEDNFTIAQSTVHLDELGRAIPVTGKLVGTSQIEIEPIMEEVLRNRILKVMDCIHAVAFRAGQLFYTPLTATSGTFTGAVALPNGPLTFATANMNAWHFREVIDMMRDTLMIPPYFADSDEYAAVVTGQVHRGLYDDPDFEKVQLYAEPDARLRGEIGRYYNCRIVRTNHIGALSNAVGNGGVLGEAVFFGDDPVIHHVAVAPEIRLKNADDYGRRRGLAWYGDVTTDPVWRFLVDGQTRMIYVSSAAAAI